MKTVAVTAMYLFVGYCHALDDPTLAIDKRDINEYFSDGGESDVAALLFDVAAEFHATAPEHYQEGPGVWLYDVAEGVGTAIGERVLQRFFGDDEPPGIPECVNMLRRVTAAWHTQI